MRIADIIEESIEHISIFTAFHEIKNIIAISAKNLLSTRFLLFTTGYISHILKLIWDNLSKTERYKQWQETPTMLGFNT